MASQVRRKRWDAESGTFVDDNDEDSKSSRQSGRNQNNQNQRNSQGNRESKGKNVQRGNSAQQNNRGNNVERDDRRGQSRQDNSGYDGDRDQRDDRRGQSRQDNSGYDGGRDQRNDRRGQSRQDNSGYDGGRDQRNDRRGQSRQDNSGYDGGRDQREDRRGQSRQDNSGYDGGRDQRNDRRGQSRQDNSGYDGDRDQRNDRRGQSRQDNSGYDGGRDQRNDRRGQSRQDNSGYDGGRDQRNDRRSHTPPSTYSQPPNYPPPLGHYSQPLHNMPYGVPVAAPILQPVIYQTVMHSQIPAPPYSNQQPYYPPPMGPSMPQYGVPPPPYSPNIGPQDSSEKKDSKKKNNSGRERQDGRQQNNKRQDGNAGRQRNQSSRSTESMGTEDDDDNRSQNERNNRGRGKQGGKPQHSRGRDGNTGSMQRSPSVDSVGTNDGVERTKPNKTNNRGRGRQDGEQCYDRGRGGYGNANRMPRNSRGRGRQDGEQCYDRGRGGYGNANRMLRNIRGRGRQDGELGNNRGRGGYGNANRMPRNNRGRGRDISQEMFQGNRRGFRRPYRGGIANRERNSSFTGSGEYSDCSASIVSFSDGELEDGQRTFELDRRGRGRQMCRGRNNFPRGPRKCADRKFGSLLQMLPQRDPIRSWNVPRGRNFRGRWSGLASRQENMMKKDNSDDFDDSVSLVSEVSAFDDESNAGKSSNASQKSINLENIKLDDLFTISLVTLKNRLKRHKKKLSDMKKNKEDPNAIEAYECKLKLVIDAKEQRDRDEKNNSNLTKDKSVSEQCADAVDEDTSSDDTVHDVHKKNVIKKSHVISTVKGRVSYQPKRNKKVKLSAKQNRKPLVDASNADSEVMSDDDEEWIEESVCRPKEQVPKKKQMVKREHKVSSDSNDNGMIGESIVEDDQTVNKQVSKKSRNRKRGGKKNNTSENVEENDTSSTEKQLLSDILGKLDNIILNEKKDKAVSKDSYPGTLKEDVSNNDDKEPKKQQIKPKKKNRKEEKKVAKDQPMGSKDIPVVESPSGKSFVGTEKKPGREHKVSESAGPDVNEVFKFMVKTLDGKGTPEEIVRESGLFPVNFDSTTWFSRLRSRFNLLERNGSIEMVFVLNRDASYCLDYTKNKSCDKPACTRYHVCKNMLSGYCMYGPGKCKYSHNLLDERNRKISKELGFSNVFTNEEICSILQVRFPHTCTSWMESGTCSIVGCSALHICPRFIYGKCLEGDDCQLVHDKTSEHNKPIINAYNMSKWNDGLFKKMIYVVRKGASDDMVAEHTEVEQTEVDELAEREPVVPGISEDSDIAGEASICFDHLVGECQGRNCNCIHSNQKLPYIWQILLFGTWVTVDESEEVEKCFCDKSDFSNMCQLIHNEMEIGARIFFKPYIRGVANLAQPGSDKMSVTARRLSTLSYKQSATESTYLTQWRWYWLDDKFQWQLFQPDVMQHTLESKFLAKQSEYNFSREDYRFKYTISFDAMVQKNLEVGTERNIVRRPLFVSSNDVREKIFPAYLSGAPEIKVPLPDNWVPWDLVNPFELVRLCKSDPSYTSVSESFYTTLNPSQQKITDIFRVQNHKLWALFKNQEEYMQSNYQRVGKNVSVDRRDLFHGTTTWNAVRGISINNFDMRVSGTHGTLYGDGAYFARDAKYSHNYTSATQRLMFVSSVLVGRYTNGNKTYRRPPEIPGNQHELYDSCVDNVDNPKIFVVFDKNQFYPGYLIQYDDLLDASAVGAQLGPQPPRGNPPGYGCPTSSSARPTPTSPGTGNWSSSSSERSQASASGTSIQQKNSEPRPSKKDDSCSIQ